MYGTYQRLRVSVLATDREVIRAVRREFKRSVLATHDQKTRATRRAVYSLMLDYHKRARALYMAAMRG